MNFDRLLSFGNELIYYKSVTLGIIIISPFSILSSLIVIIFYVVHKNMRSFAFNLITNLSFNVLFLNIALLMNIT